VPAGKHDGSCINHLGLDICFYEYNYHDSLQVPLIEGMENILKSYIGHLQ